MSHEVLTVKSRARVDPKAHGGLVCLVARKNRKKNINENKRTTDFHKQLILTQHLQLSLINIMPSLDNKVREDYI